MTVGSTVATGTVDFAVPDIITAPEERSQAVVEAERWRRDYARRLGITDACLIIVVLLTAYLVRWGISNPFDAQVDLMPGLVTLNYFLVSIMLLAIWLIVLQLMGSRDLKVIGAGSAEYSRVASATVYTFGLAAIAAVALRLSFSRTFLLTSFFAGLVVLVFARWCWRQWLGRQRRQGHCMTKVILVGDAEKCRHAAEQIVTSQDGYQLVGACVNDQNSKGILIDGVPLLGLGDPAELAEASGADTLVYVGSASMGPQQLKELSYRLGNRGMTFVAAIGLRDIAGPRVSSYSVAGLPFVEFDYPEINIRGRIAKRAMDLIGSIVALILSSPIMLAVTIAVKVTSPGPALFRHERIGRNGKPFTMLKFRSMVTNADDIVLTPTDDASARDPFKMRNDPRVTKVGAFIRKYSLDEIPQFLNVLCNDMSLVGPRPQVQREVDMYGEWDYRRLLVKPGITGLWQVSGRSNLSWEDSIRLDLAYVENWSLLGDLVILFRTVKTVIRPDGAY